MPRLLNIFGGHEGGRTAVLTDALLAGIRDLEEDIDVRSMSALQAGPEDLLWAQGLLVGTPEHFGYMSGAVKDFFDRTFYRVEGRTESLPFGLYISAGNDGTGASSSIQRISIGYKWKLIADPVIVVGAPDAAAIQKVHELGQTMAAGLCAGIF